MGRFWVGSLIRDHRTLNSTSETKTNWIAMVGPKMHPTFNDVQNGTLRGSRRSLFLGVKMMGPLEGVVAPSSGVKNGTLRGSRRSLFGWYSRYPLSYKALRDISQQTDKKPSFSFRG